MSGAVCAGCGACERALEIFAGEDGYFIGAACECDEAEPVRVSKGFWQTFNGAEQALESDEYERL